MKSLEFDTNDTLPCACYAGDVVLCVTSSLVVNNAPYITAKISSFDFNCGSCKGNSYIFSYDEGQLIDPDRGLLETDISGAFCKGCLTSYIDYLIANIPTPPPVTQKIDTITFNLGDGTNPIVTGVSKCFPVPYDADVLSWTVVSDDAAVTSGSIVVDVWKAALGGYPPTVLNTMIGAGNKPTLASATNATALVSGWTATHITAGDVLRFNIDSAATVKSITLVLAVRKT